MACFTYVVVDPLKYSVIAAFRRKGSVLGRSEVIALVLNQLSIDMLVVLFVAGLLVCAVILVEWRTAGLSEAIMSAGLAQWIIFLAALFWFGHAYLMPGHLLMGDFGNHIALVALRLRALREGFDPYWNNFQFLGQPVPEFYSPTTFWPITLIGLAVHDPTLATKIFLLLVHIGSGCAAYALAREYGLRRGSAWFSGLIYAGSFAHLHLILYRGTVPNALSIAILPLAFLFLHQCLTRDRPGLGATFGLAVMSASLLMNYAPFGVAAGLFMVIYVAGMLLSETARWQRLPQLVGAAVAAVALSAWVLMPAMLASRENAAIALDHVLYLGLPSAEVLNHLFVWRAWRTNYGHDSSAYLGVIAVALAGFGLWHSVQWARIKMPSGQRRLAWLMVLLGLISLVLHGDFLRGIIFTLLFLAILAGIGAEAVLARFAAYRSAPALLAGLLLLDLGPTAVQPLARTDLSQIDAAGAYLAQPAQVGRTLEGTVDNGRFEATTGGGADLLQLYPAEFVVGGYLQLAGPAQNFAELAAELVGDDLRSRKELSSEALGLLCQLRVRRVVAVNRASMGLPSDIPAREDGPLGRVIAPACPYDVVFSASTAAVGHQAFDAHAVLETASARMHLDLASGVADCLLVSDPIQVAVNGRAHADARPVVGRFVVSRYQVTPDRVHVALVSDRPGFVRLPQGWYRQQVVSVNGNPRQTFPDVMGLIVVPVAAGSSVIEVSPGVTPGQAVGRALSLATALALAAVFVVAHRGSHVA